MSEAMQENVARPATPSKVYKVDRRPELAQAFGELVDRLMLSAGDLAVEKCETVADDGESNTLWAQAVNRTIERHCRELMAFIWD